MKTNERLNSITHGVVASFNSKYDNAKQLFSIPAQLILLKAEVLEWAFIWLETEKPFTIHEAHFIYDMACKELGLYWELDGCTRNKEQTITRLVQVEQMLADQYNLDKALGVNYRRTALLNMACENKMQEDELYREWSELYSTYMNIYNNEEK